MPMVKNATVTISLLGLQVSAEVLKSAHTHSVTRGRGRRSKCRMPSNSFGDIRRYLYNQVRRSISNAFDLVQIQT
jgi:hypothetical protein